MENHKTYSFLVNRKFLFAIILSSLIISTLLLSSCVSYTGGYKKLEESSIVHNIPVISFTAKYYMHYDVDYIKALLVQKYALMPFPTQPSGELVDGSLNIVREESPLYGKEMFREEIQKFFVTKPGSTDVINTSGINVDFFMIQSSSPSIPIMIANGIVSVMTCLFIPMYMKINYDMIAIVSRQGSEVKQYHYKHARHTWVQTLLMFYPLAGVSSCTQKIFDDMLTDFRYDFMKLSNKSIK